MIDVISQSGALAIDVIFKKFIQSGSEASASASVNLKAIFETKAGKDNFDTLGTFFRLFINKDNLDIQNNDQFIINGKLYFVYETSLKSSNPFIKPFYQLSIDLKI